MIKFQSKEFFFSSVVHFLLWTEYLTYLPFYDWQGSLRVIWWPPDETARGCQQSARIRSGFLRLSSHKEISFLIVWKILISNVAISDLGFPICGQSHSNVRGHKQEMIKIWYSKWPWGCVNVIHWYQPFVFSLLHHVW